MIEHLIISSKVTYQSIGNHQVTAYKNKTNFQIILSTETVSNKKNHNHKKIIQNRFWKHLIHFEQPNVKLNRQR